MWYIEGEIRNLLFQYLPTEYSWQQYFEDEEAMSKLFHNIPGPEHDYTYVGAVIGEGFPYAICIEVGDAEEDFEVGDTVLLLHTLINGDVTKSEGHVSYINTEYTPTRMVIKDLPYDYRNYRPSGKIWRRYSKEEQWPRGARILVDVANYYEDKSREPKPNERPTYSDEHSIAANDMVPFMKRSIEEGAAYLYGTMQISGINMNIWTISRKAGLLGGMYELPQGVDCIRQPGIISLHFEENGTPIYYKPYADENRYLSLYYDMITFGDTKIEIKARKADNSEMLLKEITLPGVNRYMGLLTIDTDEFGLFLSGVREIFANILTKRLSGTSYELMLSTDYEDAYNAHDEIRNNRVYQEWFAFGDPVRESGEDPFTNPKIYWPYVIQITAYGKLGAPINFIATPSTSTRITLTWQDNSNYEEGYVLQEQHAGSNWQVLDTLEANTESYTHYVSRYTDHWYRLYGYNSTYDVYSDTVYTWATSSPILASDGITYGPRSRNIVREVTSNDEALLHAVFMSDGKIIYRISTDNGYTWSSEEILDSNAHNPTISLISYDDEQLPVVAWLKGNSCLLYTSPSPRDRG